MNVPDPTVGPDDDAHRNRGELRASPDQVDSRNKMVRGRVIFDAERHRMGRIVRFGQGESVDALREARPVPGIGRRQVEADKMIAALGD
jgi:hypothetical protein